MAQTESRPAARAYGGYYHRDVPEDDTELTRVGPGTPCGEYLRRFWHPVGLSAALRDLPRAIRVLGEDLVLFRNTRGEVGLLGLHCSHRGTSLEYATVESRGLRCCYHGWLYGVDGRILDTPGEPPESSIKERVYHGAYPTIEYRGLIFAYMGPPERRPAFPIFDTFELQGYRIVPEGHMDPAEWQPCNWLQLAENNMDAVHTIYLHGLEESRARLDRFRPGVSPDGSMDRYRAEGVPAWEHEVADLRDDFRNQRVIEWRETHAGLMYIHTRRIGDMVWVRMADYMMPNMDQIPITLSAADETKDLPFDAPRTTTWTVPVDDTHTTTFGFQYKPENREQNGRWRFTRPESSTVRTYEDRQRQPGDYEGQVSQRPVAVHALEHLGWSDQGVVLIRKLVREGVRAVQRGEDPKHIGLAAKGVINTYGQSVVMRVPPAATHEDDKELLRRLGQDLVARREAGLLGMA